MQLLSVTIAVLFLAALGAFGVMVLRRWCAGLLAPIELAAYGPPFGIVIGSLAILATACVAGMHPWLSILIALLSIAGTLSLRPWVVKNEANETSKTRKASGSERSRRKSDSSGSREGKEPIAQFAMSPRGILGSVGVLPAIVIGAFAIRWAIFYWTGYTEDATGIWAGNTGFWADWALHIGDVMSFAAGENFPPQHPRYSGVAYPYHYLTSITAAATVQFGVDVTTALTLQSFLLSLFILLGLYAFARRLTNDSTIAAITITLFMLGATLGWVLTLAEMNDQHSILGVLQSQAWNGAQQEASNFRFQNFSHSLS